MQMFLAACVCFLGTLFFSPVVANVARRFGVMDQPGSLERKRERRPTPLWGGVAIIVVLSVVILGLHHLGLLPHGLVAWNTIVGLLIGGGVLLIGGMLDDRYALPPWAQVLWTIVAVSIVVLSGVTISTLRNPFGGLVSVAGTEFELGVFLGHAFRLHVPGDALAFVWILTLTYTTKVLDGLDGLVAGLTTIAAVLIIGVALRPELNQPDVAVLAAAGAGAFAGFLVWNAPPATVFLGEAGSTFAGFFLGSIAVISGSKVATTLLILGVPIVDLALVVLGRLRDGKRVVVGDGRHLHFRLLAAGVSEKNAVLFFYTAAILFGLVGLLASTAAKIVSFLLLSGIMVFVSRSLERRGKKSKAGI
jgi:UDP-GlcNAc:undecaprenyl-phosphate GlcNAc-1-phosphate transferase